MSAPPAAIELASLPPLRAVIAAYGLTAHKSLGQHFLLDLNLTRRIARAAGELAGGLEGVTVIEIGPGPGGLTRALLASAAKAVVAIERDRRCLAALAPLVAVSGGRLTLIAGDALAIDPASLAPPPRAIVANLPYNIATALLLKWLPDIRGYRSLTLMFQKEVAQRLAARPGGGDYGRLSVWVQWHCAVKLLFDLPARAFTPPPNVTSTLVALTPLPAPPAPPASARPDSLERVLAAAFGQRRKMLRASLKRLGAGAPDPVALLTAAGIDPTARAETLSVEQFCALARALDAQAVDQDVDS